MDQNIPLKKQYEFQNVKELKLFISYQQKDNNQYKLKLQKLLQLPEQENILRFNNNLTLDDFINKYDSQLPIIIKDLDKEWENWQWNYLFNKYQNYYFRCAIDDDGNYLKLKFNEYVNYLQNNNDFNPLYIFDGDIPNDILKQYQIPYLFKQDYLSYLQQKRPQYRWILCGPKQSGSMIHIDPYETSAWNCVVLGKKRWIMFSPNIDKKIVKGKGLLENDELQKINNPIDYFYILVPLLKQYCKNNNIEYYDFIQNEHETVYVPNGWWHAVLNIEDCVAVTQNYVSDQNFIKFWIAFNKENPILAKQFQQIIQQQNNNETIKLLNIIKELNIQEIYHQNQQDQEDNISQQDSLEEFQNLYD